MTLRLAIQCQDVTPAVNIFSKKTLIQFNLLTNLKLTHLCEKHSEQDDHKNFISLIITYFKLSSCLIDSTK